MTSITEKIQRILRSTLSSNVVDDDNKIQDKTTILSSETQNRLKLREVLEDDVLHGDGFHSDQHPLG